MKPGVAGGLGSERQQGSWPCSASPQRRQRSGGERTGLRLSHSATQLVKARPGLQARSRPPSTSAIPARSSKKTCQSSRDQSSRPCRSSATISDLWRASRLRITGGRGAAASSARSSPSRRSSTPAALAAFRALAALAASPSSLRFPAQIGAGDLRPHRPHRSHRWISTGWRGLLNCFLALYRPHRPRPSAEAWP